jgi:hypothetical protein
MPPIQGGPPEWIWERTLHLLKWDIVQAQAANGHPLLELRVQCGLEIMRLQFFTEDEFKELRDVIVQRADSLSNVQPAEAGRSGRAPSTHAGIANSEDPQEKPDGVVSEPDFAAKR